MEARKERRQEVANTIRKRAENVGESKANNNVNKPETVDLDAAIKKVIRGSIISNNQRAQAPDDLLAFSRCLHNVDSSLE